MKTFERIENETLFFSSCETCEAHCCDGERGILYTQILLEDFEKVYENFPIVFMYGELGYLKPVILLTNGKEFCRYLENNLCTIYEKRPSTCRNYPLSAHLDNSIYVDKNCPAITNEGTIIVKDGKINKEFNNYSFSDYQIRYINTHFCFHEINNSDNLTKAITLNGIDFYKFVKDFDDKYVSMHLKSLKNIDEYYLKAIK
ncbi:YkgJ family cysteine cluster protein [Malaciobacter marinus]|jgi:hypothetical protein|uniref:YkgJ family cysteine cluster protein n=1 Tax=Malaciobacter marinus TaxID=505249 RepID=UPI0009A5B683|nr:YkgJ family cysteine cluster protein [Malaciobacter marinus]SKB74584.1 hypothetical protein SAMN06295997_13816 [Malaciobacter marinus]